MKTYDDFALVEEYRKCRCCRIVAEKFGCSGETVRRALIKYKEPRITKKPRPITKKKATEGELRHIVTEYYAEGVTIKNLASKYHRSQVIISEAISRYGNGLKSYDSNAKKISNEQLVNASKTMTPNEIAEKFCMHPETVRRRLKRMGISPKKPEPKPQTSHQRGRSWSEYCEEQKRLVEQRKKTREVEKHWFNAIHTVERECTVCGKIFFCLDSETRVTCSHECSCEYRKIKRRENDRRRSRRQKKHKHDASYRGRCKKYGVRYDSSVKRDDVLKRDKYTCQICGKKCNPNDKSWGTSGPDYPTLDHIVPLAKGGAHVWANVQCACGLCNSYKRDLLESV
jgi:5-methylcytosine-specific restriction endonuclease McrA/transposase